MGLLYYAAEVSMEKGIKEWNNYAPQNDSSASGTVKAEEEGYEGLRQ